MAVQPVFTPLPPNVHVVYEVLCDEGPQTGRALERLLARRGVVVPVDRLLELPRRYPSAFAIDAAERLAVPPGCDRCGAHGCDTCQRDVGAAACLACGRTVCRECRGEGAGLRALCADCAAPRRLPEADLRYCRAWALGSECRLLVGERSAMLLGGPDRPLVMVPDADLDDPVRRRLRALAAALRVPPEIGLRWAGPAPAMAAAGQFTASLQVREVPAWDWLPAGGSQVDPDAAAALPEAEGPPVDAESAGGLTALLARLRAQAPPPPVGALAVTPLLEVTRISLAAGGLERRAERHRPGGEIETLAVEPAPRWSRARSRRRGGWSAASRTPASPGRTSWRWSATRWSRSNSLRTRRRACWRRPGGSIRWRTRKTSPWASACWSRSTGRPATATRRGRPRQRRTTAPAAPTWSRRAAGPGRCWTTPASPLLTSAWTTSGTCTSRVPAGAAPPACAPAAAPAGPTASSTPARDAGSPPAVTAGWNRRSRSPTSGASAATPARATAAAGRWERGPADCAGAWSAAAAWSRARTGAAPPASTCARRPGTRSWRWTRPWRRTAWTSAWRSTASGP